MDAAEVLRAVRRRQGWSQRELARRSGIAQSTVAAVEAGRRSPSVGLVSAVLAVAGLELTVDVAVPPPDEATVRHLHLSLGSRLHLACGGDGRPDRRPAPGTGPVPVWTALLALAARHTVHLHGATALAVWLPVGTVAPAVVCVHDGRLDGGLTAAPPSVDVALVEVRAGCGSHTGHAVAVRVGHWQVAVDPPGELALRPEHVQHRTALRAVARRLHEQAPVDSAGRRTRAHRDPDHLDEHDRVLFDTRLPAFAVRSPSDVRSWRLDDDASLVAWLRRQGFRV
jgi:DNA-binding XRE family transcriptional regulator